MRKPQHPPVPGRPHGGPEPAISTAAVAIFNACREPLLTWFTANARDLPWRAPLESSREQSPESEAPTGLPGVVRKSLRSPYGVWVAEIMLQQTVVAAVVSHYKRWMAEFPTVEALAAAAPENVLRAWAGLGYYARARNLHKGAQAVAAWRRERETWPVTAEEWRTIPGVGEYTAGAIASLAFGQRAALLDGNVVRVFSRLLGLGFLPGEGAAAKKQYWDLARLWVEDAAAARSQGPAALPAGALNEGLMELGALVCTPASPRCEACPLRDACAARRGGWVARLPPRKPRAPAKAVAAVAVVATGRGGVLMETRAAGGFLAGHDLFPLFLGAEAAAWNESFAARFSEVALRAPRRVATVKHTIMTTRYEVEVVKADLAKAVASNAVFRTVPSSRMDEALTNALARKIWRVTREA